MKRKAGAALPSVPKCPWKYSDLTSPAAVRNCSARREQNVAVFCKRAISNIAERCLRRIWSASVSIHKPSSSVMVHLQYRPALVRPTVLAYLLQALWSSVAFSSFENTVHLHGGQFGRRLCKSTHLLTNEANWCLVPRYKPPKELHA